MIRLADPAEAPLLAALAERAYAHYPAVIGRRPAPMDDDYAARIAQGEAWVLEEAGAIQALLVLEERPGQLWLDNIAVDPGRQHGGLGRRLMRFVAEEALRRGLPEVGLLTNEKMTRNIAFYARLGFTEQERREENGFRRVLFSIPARRLLD